MASARLHPLLGAAAASAALAIAVFGACGEEATSKPRTAIPNDAAEIAAGIVAADYEWRVTVDEWQAAGAEPPFPAEAEVPGGYVQRASRLLAARRNLAGQTLRRLPPALRVEVRQMIRAVRDLRRLAAGWPGGHEIRSGAPTSLDVLMPAYGEAKRRFGVHFRILAAVNHVESAFGRARSNSVAGAQGPMQFIPSTWEVYGLGGNIRDPRDAILGAANYLDQSGAPGSYRDALYAYNPSQLYVDAVLRYARLIAADRDNFYLLYTWPIRGH